MKKNYLIVIFIMSLLLMVNIICFEYENRFTDKFVNFKDFDWKKSDTIKIEKDTVYTQTIYSKKNNLNNIRLYLDLIDGNYSDRDFLALCLKFTLKDDQGKIIDSYKYETILFKNKNKYIDFKFKKIKDSKNKLYYLDIESFDVLDKEQVVFNTVDSDSTKYILRINNEIKKDNQTLLYTTMYHSNKKMLIFIGIDFMITTFLAVLAIYILKKGNLKIEKKYLILSILIGVIMILIIPPQKGNDETSHLVRAYDISNGNIVTKNINGWPQAKIPSKFYNSFNNYSEIDKAIESKTNKNVYYDMEYSGVYPPLSYIPHVIALIISKVFVKNIFWWHYLVRLIQLLFSVLIIYYAIKIVPYGKKNVLIIGLIPTVFRQISLISADASLISCSILFICYSLYINEKKSITKKDIVLLTIISVIMSISKLVYIPLCLLFVVLTKNIKWKQKKKCFFIILLSSILFSVLWNSIALYNLKSGQGVNVSYYFKYYLKYPFEFVVININNIFKMGFKYINELFGAQNYPYKLIDSGIYPIIFIILYYENAVSLKKVSYKEKMLIISLIVITCLLINTSLHITCSPVYTNYIVGIQGRYFTPLLLPVALILGKDSKSDNLITKYYDIIIIIMYQIYIIENFSYYFYI